MIDGAFGGLDKSSQSTRFKGLRGMWARAGAIVASAAQPYSLQQAHITNSWPRNFTSPHISKKKKRYMVIVWYEQFHYHFNLSRL